MTTRKPIMQEQHGGKGLRQRVWERIRNLPPESWFVLLDVVWGDEKTETVREYLLGITAAGYLEAIEPERINGRAQAKRYRLVRDNGMEAPRVRRDGSPVTQGLAQEQMWRSLRMSKADTNARELAAHASTPQVPVDAKAAADYLLNLNRGGYLICTAKGHGIGKGGVQARYKLDPAKDSGPKPPMVCRTKALFDPNLGEIVWQPTLTEEDAIYG